jgi:S1-C subfamily serine protease
MTRSHRYPLSGLLALLVASAGYAQTEPSLATREKTLESVVYIRAGQCTDNSQRAGTGFAHGAATQIVTAHHVVGGCQTITVSYERLRAQGGPVSHPATIERVLAASDLALLRVNTTVTVPAAGLALAPPPPNRQHRYYGSGYQNGQPSAGDQEVAFSVGSDKLRDILPSEAVRELQANNSAIDLDQRVLRFNIALQPGTSGGPIIDANGQVIGVVAGGLKAGAAPASWGWPADWIPRLLTSNENRATPVIIARSFYSLNEMAAEANAISSNRQITCGGLSFSYRGTRPYQAVATGTDDRQRLSYLEQLSRLPSGTINEFSFDIWQHAQSGATLVTPAGHNVTAAGNVCSIDGGDLKQVAWAAQAGKPDEIQRVSLDFENNVMIPRLQMPYGYFFDWALTTQGQPVFMQGQWVPTPGPQFRDNNMVFNRKGLILPQAPWQPNLPPPPRGYAFQTLIAKSGSFLGVGTINREVHRDMDRCLNIGITTQSCRSAYDHLKLWTHFMLATQLSTYPAT